MPDSDIETAVDTSGLEPTRQIGCWIAEADSAQFGDIPIRWAKHALLDWLGVTLGGSHDPLIEILIADAIASGEVGRARLVGRHARTAQTFATMINGAAGHALDFDDVNKRLHGHPTVPVVPALLAIAEHNGASGRAVLEAFIVGYEVECLIGEMMGLAHYDHGWHATATVGTFGAAAGAARLLGLDANKTAMALGIAATQAAGLKSMFGTMCKPLHAGKAAMNGLMAARWAARGFTSRDDALECAQGFGLTQSTDFKVLPIRPDPAAPFAVEENLFKYHAACYLIHSSVEAVRVLREKHGITAADVAAVTTHVDAQHRQVCDIPEPATGLEVKFSIRHCIAMALNGISTGDGANFTDEVAQRDDLVALRRKVDLVDTSHANRYAADVTVTLNDGSSHTESFDVGAPAADLDAQETRLVAKFQQLAEPVIGAARADQTLALVRDLDSAEGIEALMVAVD